MNLTKVLVMLILYTGSHVVPRLVTLEALVSFCASEVGGIGPRELPDTLRQRGGMDNGMDRRERRWALSSHG